jgi:hypothetical protein
MQALSSIDFDLTGIGGILVSRLLAVPIYQRPYSWRETPVNEFWTDLRTAFGKKSPEYFLGTIVLTKQGTVGRDTIIDGQQRLATTAMLLASIRGEYKARGDAKRASIIHSDYLSAADLESGQEVSRLRLSSDDDPFFKTLVVDDIASTVPTRGSHELIKAAYTALQKAVKTVAADAGAEWSKRLLEWVEFLKTKVFVISLEVPTEADAFLIFETLNDRGADLTIADLLKNFLFGRAEDQLDTVRDGWLMALGSLEITQANATFTMFLRHYWSSHRGAIRERELYKDIKDNVTSVSQAVDFVGALQKAARLYAALLNSDHDYWATLGTEGRANVETLLRLDLEQIRPLLLGAMQHFQTAELQRLLRALVSWAVRGIIVGGIGGGTYEKAYCDAAVKIRKGDIKTVDELFKEITRIIPTDEEFKAAFAVARVPKSNLARYYLIALEGGKKGEKEPELVPNADENQVNLEHVLPKNASDSDWGGTFTLDERKDWVFRVGNLALLQKGPNGRIGNKPFTVKRPILAASSLELTKEIGAQATWSPATIQTRQNALSQLAITVWPRKP